MPAKAPANQKLAVSAAHIRRRAPRHPWPRFHPPSSNFGGVGAPLLSCGAARRKNCEHSLFRTPKGVGAFNPELVPTGLAKGHTGKLAQRIIQPQQGCITVASPGTHKVHVRAWLHRLPRRGGLWLKCRHVQWNDHLAWFRNGSGFGLGPLPVCFFATGASGMAASANETSARRHECRSLAHDHRNAANRPAKNPFLWQTQSAVVVWKH